MLMVCARASSNVIWQNSDLQRAEIIVVAELLSWLCLQTRFRQILEGARIVATPAHRRAPRQLLELLVEPRNLAFDCRQRL